MSNIEKFLKYYKQMCISEVELLNTEWIVTVSIVLLCRFFNALICLNIILLVQWTSVELQMVQYFNL